MNHPFFNLDRLLECTYVAIFFVIVGCSSTIKIQSEEIVHLPSEKYNSFKFFNVASQPPSNFSFSEENKKILFDATAAELKKQGFTSTQDAQMIVKIQGGTVRKIQKNDSYYPHNSYNSYYNGWYYPYQYDSFYKDISKKQTTIIIDILDAGSRKLLWQGVATGEMGKTKEEVEDKLVEAVRLIFEKFPVSN